MAPYKILKQGYMLKEPPPTKRGLRKKLYRYWFVLVEDKHQVALVYFKSENSYLARHRNEGFIRVDDAVSISVIGEYLGGKNAFSVTSPKHKYILVPESRYDLHEWILILHNTLEAFTKRKERARGRTEQRQRANSASSTGRAQAKSPPTTPTTTTKTTPTRRAPPPPPMAAAAASKPGVSPRRRPVRPAPAAPGKKKQESLAEQPGGPSPMLFYEDDTPPPGYMATSQDDSEQFSSYHFEQHPIMDLDISQTDHDFEGGRAEREQGYHLPEPLPEPVPEREGERDPEPHPSPPVHFRSASDSLVLFHENTHSMPDLYQEGDEHEKSTSPEDGSTDSDISRKKSDLVATHPSPKISHTRHLSLIGSQVPARKKKSKRVPSLKRSRSPPELPPPPPPPGQDEAGAVATEQTQESLTVETSARKLRNDNSTSSIGFSEVLNTISSIELQLDELSPDPEPVHMASLPPPTAEAPQRLSASQLLGVSTFKPMEPLPMSVPEYPEGRPKGESVEQLDFSCLDEDGDNGQGSGSEEEEEQEGETTSSPGGMQGQSFDTAINLYSGESFTNVIGDGEPLLERTTPEGAHVSPINVSEEEIMSEIISEKQAKTNGIVGATKPPREKRVMFKEEVESIPTYEPRVDEEEVPSTVAELKKMLFGQKEAETSRFKRGEPKRLDYYEEEHELNYEYHRDGRSPSPPNNNNNNSGAVLGGITETPEEETIERTSSPELPPPDLDDGEEDTNETENVYDTPWDKKPASKYVNSGGSLQKPRETSPLGHREMLHFAEVSTHEGPIPGNTELRNVHSLERRSKRQTKSASTDLEGSSLLESISSTLQSRSKYGSDSLLSDVASTPTVTFPPQITPSSQSSPPRRGRQEVRSARGELEKIKAEHRRDVRYSPQASPRSPLQQRAKTRTRFAQLNGQPPRMAASLDELQRDSHTEVRYDVSTHAHIYRSLV